jgi:hypothetical protein
MRVIILMLLLHMPMESFGWWDSGHKLVCDVAERYLLPSAQKEVKSLLGGQNKFAEGCVWPDTIKKERSYTSPWHYVNLPPDEIQVNDSHCPEEGCIMSAFYEQLAILKDKAADKQLRKEALLFIGHFVADIHQPFHAGNKEDRGANGYRVLMPNGKNYGMHSVWDGHLPNYAAQKWGDEFDKVFIKSLQTQGATLKYDENIYQWATESRIIAMSDSVGYKNGSVKRITKKYLNTHHQIVVDRLALASARLTILLNGVFQ